ncbi:MAG: phosphotransferase [Gammaproteobacteria bacterium]|nr:phosphotransferase [Gammaproteobacteria bacterium]
MDDRLAALEQWVSGVLGTTKYQIEPASADASFRRYFRIQFTDQERTKSRIVMDAPPGQEDTAPFIAIAETLRSCGVNAPEVYAIEPTEGFLLLSDLGHTPYLMVLDRESVKPLYEDAIQTLLQFQLQWPKSHRLPPYDHKLLMSEMELFPVWYLQRHLGKTISEPEQQQWRQQFELLAAQALQQPQVAVHRDYHSRNLMALESANPGVIDFQDAVWGPITYDLVSLLRDCYIDWPRNEVEAWAAHYYQRLVEKGQSGTISWEQFLHGFDWMGVQRHLKAVGIFARLNHRDGKPGYLQDIPRTLNYLVEVSGRYPALAPLHQWVRELG